MSDEIIMPGKWADYCGQRWKVGMVGRTGGERYYWLTRSGCVAMVPGSLVKPWTGRAAAAIGEKA